MLDISPYLLLLVFVVFMLTMIALNSLLFKPMLKFMDDRDNSIKKDLENVSSNSDEVNSLKSEAEDIILEAKKEANSIIEKAMNEAKTLAESKRAEKKSELDNQHKKFIDSLEEEKVALKNTLFSQMPLYRESLKAKISKL